MVIVVVVVVTTVLVINSSSTTVIVIGIKHKGHRKAKREELDVSVIVSNNRYSINKGINKLSYPILSYLILSFSVVRGC